MIKYMIILLKKILTILSKNVEISVERYWQCSKNSEIYIKQCWQTCRKYYIFCRKILINCVENFRQYCWNVEFSVKIMSYRYWQICVDNSVRGERERGPKIQKRIWQKSWFPKKKNHFFVYPIFDFRSIFYL